MISYKVKGIILAVIISLASIMMPFSVYASVQSQIVPTFSSTTSQWSTHLSVTNFSDGTNNQASSTLSFTFDDDYYGMIYFDGYGPSNQHIANYAVCFVAGGYGEYRYSYYQNGVINITSITIQIVNVVKPQSTVDLTQIISLLTAIENDTSSIDNVLDSTLLEIRNILSQLIVSNGYLETLTKIRQYNVPIESFSALWYGFSQNSDKIVDLFNYSYWNYPIFDLKTNDILYRGYFNTQTYDVVMITYSTGMTLANLPVFIDFDGGTISDFNVLFYGNAYRIVKFKLKYNTNAYYDISLLRNLKVTLLYVGFSNNISTDFALQFGLSNNLLDNIEIIANGTTSSNSAASDLDDASSNYSSIADDVVTVENGLTSNFETSVNQIDLNTGLSGFGGNFMTSATWVRTQFDRLTENTPYGSLVVYGLTLGFVLLMLGKVLL